MGKAYNLRGKRGSLHGYPHKLGSVSKILDELNPDQIDWIMDDIPEGLTVADAIRLRIIDAYFDEIDKP